MNITRQHSRLRSGYNDIPCRASVIHSKSGMCISSSLKFLYFRSYCSGWDTAAYKFEGLLEYHTFSYKKLGGIY
jgi:hypothetical protein